MMLEFQLESNQTGSNPSYRNYGASVIETNVFGSVVPELSSAVFVIILLLITSTFFLLSGKRALSTINRIVIDPKYRTIGLGEKIIQETLPQVGTPYVELVAVMAKYSPFAEKAGMQKIIQQQSVEGIKKLTQTLQHLGFNLQLIGSQHYVESKLEELSEEQINELKNSFIANKHPRFKKDVASSRYQPYGQTTQYISYVQTADVLRICRLIRVFAMLSQTKIYLFWRLFNE